MKRFNSTDGITLSSSSFLVGKSRGHYGFIDEVEAGSTEEYDEEDSFRSDSTAKHSESHGFQVHGSGRLNSNDAPDAIDSGEPGPAGIRLPQLPNSN